MDKKNIMLNEPSIIVGNKVNYCYCCGGEDIVDLGIRKETLSNTTGLFCFTYMDAICSNCTFVFSKNRQKSDGINHYYKNYHPESSSTSTKEHLMRYKALIKYLQCTENAYEIGGGENGRFTNFLRNKGIKIKNIEVFDVWPKPRTADLVVSYYLLEHINDLDVFLSNINRILSSNGVFVFEVPNFVDNTSSSLNEEHVNHFNNTCVNAMAINYGFENITVETDINSRSFGVTFVFKKLYEIGCVLTNSKLLFKKNNKTLSSKLNKMKKRYYSCLKDRNNTKELINSVCKLAKDKSKKVLIWGCNQNFIRMMNILSETNVDFTIVDSSKFKQNLNYFEIPVLDPNVINFNNYHEFFICSSNAFKDIFNIITLNPSVDKSKIYKIDFSS